MPSATIQTWNSRNERRRKQREKVSYLSEQSSLTDYFVILDQVEKLETKNSQLCRVVREIITKYKSLQSRNPVGCESTPTMEKSIILKRMMDQAIIQGKKSGRGNRFDDGVLEHFCMQLWILGGRRTYEILHANLTGIFPSPRTIESRLASFQEPILEGIEINIFLNTYLNIQIKVLRYSLQVKFGSKL